MMTVEIRDREVTFLVDTANDLRRVIDGLSDAQLRYRANDDSWSIADILEHLAVVEHAFTHHVAPQLAGAPAADPSRDVAVVDQQILAFESDPAVTATPEGRPLNRVPSVVAPRGRWQPTECAGKFFASREQTLAFLKSVTWQRHEHVFVNAGFGPLDAQQWALFLSAHVTRHVRQIEGIRAAPGFPNA
jgi:hypothetical protein